MKTEAEITAKIAELQQIYDYAGGGYLSGNDLYAIHAEIDILKWATGANGRTFRLEIVEDGERSMSHFATDAEDSMEILRQGLATKNIHIELIEDMADVDDWVMYHMERSDVTAKDGKVISIALADEDFEVNVTVQVKS
jgi:hypothetical protein